MGKITLGYLDRVESEEGEQGKRLHRNLGLGRDSLFEDKMADNYQDRSCCNLNDLNDEAICMLL